MPTRLTQYRKKATALEKLKDRSIVVTGSTRGFGFAMAEAFLREGASVMICGRGEESTTKALERLRPEAKTDGSPALAGTPCDTSDYRQVSALAQETLRQFGRIDVWVNNAGVSGPYGQLETIPREEFEAVLNTNVLGYYYGTLVALQHMLPAQAGKIINIAGLGSGGRPAPFQSPYSSSKAWVQSFTRSVAAEHKGSGVGIHVLNPGMMLTDMVTKVRATSEEGCERLERLPLVLRLIAQPPEVPARRAVWLASSATDGRTGIITKVFTARTALVSLASELGRQLTGRTKQIPPVEIERLS